MVHSMTGYGAASHSNENYHVMVELKSLNSKFVEINLKMPRSYMQQEISIRNHITKELQRGKINAVLTVEVLNPDKQKIRINHPLVQSYFKILKDLKQEIGLTDEISLEYLLSLPDAMHQDEEGADPEEWQLIQSAFAEAVENLLASRLEEGKALEADLRERLDEIGKGLEEVKAYLPERADAMRKRLDATISEIRDKAQVDGNRFEQELLYYLEKLDINEEVVRLGQHLEFFSLTLKEENPGKKLGFIAQEMGREINTIGSKANNAQIQVFVVKMKEELEKIKEQLMNIV